MSEQAQMSGIAQAAAPREVLSVGALQGVLTERLGGLRNALNDLGGKVGPILDQSEDVAKTLTAAEGFTSNNPVGLCIISQIEEVTSLTETIRSLDRRAEL